MGLPRKLTHFATFVDGTNYADEMPEVTLPTLTYRAEPATEGSCMPCGHQESPLGACPGGGTMQPAGQRRPIGQWPCAHEPGMLWIGGR